MDNVHLHSTIFQSEYILEQLLLKSYILQGTNDNTVCLSAQMCEVLRRGKRFLELDMALKALPLEDVYMKNELIVRAKIAVAFEKENYTHVYNLIKLNKFENGEDLIEIWDKAHYAEEEKRTQKPLTPLTRFRIRQRFFPPESICPTRERKKFTLPRKSKNILQKWLDENLDKPYPSRETKEYLAMKANLTKEQVKTWFANARRKIFNVRYKRCHGRGSSGNKCARDSDDALNHMTGSDTQCCLDNKTDDDDNITISEDMNDSSSDTDTTRHQDCDNTMESSSFSDDNEISSLVSFPTLSMEPTVLELVQPPVSISCNISYGLFPSIPPCFVMSKQTQNNLLKMSTGINLPLHLKPSISGQYDFQQNMQIGEEPPDISTLQDPLYEPFCGIMVEKEPLTCQQQINTLSPMSLRWLGGKDGIVCGSPGQLTRQLNAATALLDMAVPNSSTSIVD